MNGIRTVPALQNLRKLNQSQLDSTFVDKKQSPAFEHKDAHFSPAHDPQDSRDQPFNLINLPIPEHVLATLEQAALNNKLSQIRGQNALPIPNYGETKGVIFPDGSKGALISLDQTEVLFLADANGEKTYYKIQPDGSVGEQLEIGETVLLDESGANAQTLDVDASGNLTIKGLTTKEGFAKADALFKSDSGRLAIRNYPDLDSATYEAQTYLADVWHDPDLPSIKETNKQKLDTLRAQEVTQVNDNISFQTAEFVDGTRASLIDFGSDNKIYMLEDSDGNKSYYLVYPNRLGPPMGEGSYGIGGEPPLSVTADPNGTLNVHTFNEPTGVSSYSASINPNSNTLTATVNPADGTPAVTTNTSVWQGATLQDETTVGDDTYTTQALYNHYSNTPEGQAILSAEGAYFTPVDAADQRLFIARAMYNRGQGGIELFAEFMPNRTALLNDPIALEQYDVQFERALAHVQNNSHVSETGKQLDPSLQVIVASSISEAIGHSPELMSTVLDDIDRGWRIEYDATYGGLYSQHRPLFQSQKAKIHLRLSDFLTTYTDTHPEPLYSVMPHELAHSFDSYSTNGVDGIPTGMAAADVSILIEERNKLFETFVSSGNSDTSGFRDYAFGDAGEFWGEISAYYLMGDAEARVLWEASPELFEVVQRYYGLNYNFT